MIAAIRVRFTPTPASQMWNDAVFGNWLNMTVQNSLALTASRRPLLDIFLNQSRLKAI